MQTCKLNEINSHLRSAAKASSGLISLTLARHMSVCTLFAREEVEQTVESNLLGMSKKRIRTQMEYSSRCVAYMIS